MFAYEWQAKDLRDREFVRVANTGLTEMYFCACGARDGGNGGRLEDRGKRAKTRSDAEMKLARVGGIGGMGGENEMRWSESRAGWRLTITTHFTRQVKRWELA